MDKHYIIVDLDNCIADDAHRIALVDWSEDDPDARYKRYHAACALDKVCHTSLLHTHRANGLDLVVFTARPVYVQPQTQRWLENHCIQPDALLMRNIGDHRSSVEIKEQMLFEHLFHYGYDPARCVAAYDDRQDIVDMYRRHGINAARLWIHDLCAMTRPE